MASVDKFNEFAKNGYLKISEVKKTDISNYYLTTLLKEKKIEKVFKGLYLESSELNDRFYEIQYLSNKCVYSNLTALYFLEYSDRIPMIYDITVPRDYKGSLQQLENVKLYYVDKDILNLGVIIVIDEFGNEIKCYDLERCICDIIKNKNKLDRELVNKALRKYFYSANKNTKNLFDYAKKMKLFNKVREEFDILS